MSDFDVDKYRTFYECDEHWELRRAFILKHRDRFSEEEIICLAQVFTNIEFLGCRFVIICFFFYKYVKY